MLKDTSLSSAKGLLTLLAVKGVGPASAEKLARKFATLGELLEAAPSNLSGAVSASSASLLQDRGMLSSAADRANAILDKANDLDVAVHCVDDIEYPDALRFIPDRPLILYVRGSLANASKRVACIGTREPSDFGVAVTERLVELLVENDWAIVSGLALGVDTLAHQACLRFGGCTVAVMGGGLDSIYPKKNAGLADQIIEAGGALVSEQPFGVPPSPHNLVSRDRLQSGLSVGTFVMQTDIRGGSMHTVRFTLEQQRLLFAPVPTGRHALEEKSQGILALTKQPAIKFAETIAAQGEYRRLLMYGLGQKSAAEPIAGREDYDRVIQLLVNRLGDASAETPSQLEVPPRLL